MTRDAARVVEEDGAASSADVDRSWSLNKIVSMAYTGVKRQLSGGGASGSSRKDGAAVCSNDDQFETSANAESGGRFSIDMSKVFCYNHIAEGGFGHVYYGNYEGREVAVKIMTAGAGATGATGASTKFEENKTALETFKQEVDLWCDLDHANILKFIGASFGTISTMVLEGRKTKFPVWAIITEYVNGGTLQTYLDNCRSRLSRRRLFSIALDIALGMEYLHSRKIVHRDLKPSNLLISHDKSIKIADFGVARVEAINPMEMTCETGTYRWMAPEIIRGEPYDSKVDVYSFGIILWQLITGSTPFANMSWVQIANEVAHKRTRPTIPNSCPPLLEVLIEKCWDPEPARRPEFKEIVLTLIKLQSDLVDEMASKPAFCSCLMF